MNFSIFLLLLVPSLIVVGIMHFYFNSTITLKESIAQFSLTTVIIGMFFMGSLFSMTSDTQLINGMVVKKEQVTVSCYHPYTCNCRQVCSGSGKQRSCSTQCDTCYEHFNDWRWEVESNVGSQYINNVDRRGIAEPPRFTAIKIGEPYSTTDIYTNYVKAVSDSLFNFKNYANLDNYKVPAYPSIHDYYRVNRVLVVGKVKIDVPVWNDALGDVAKVVGTKKQANPILIITDYGDQTYRYAIEKAWFGAKNNDVIVIVGVNGEKLVWVDTITFGQNSGNSLMTVLMRDRIMEVGKLDIAMVGVIGRTIVEKFDRKPMKDFEYLKYSIMPSNTMLTFCFILGIIGSVGLGIFFHRNDVFN